jgi:hypothetical protein
LASGSDRAVAQDLRLDLPQSDAPGDLLRGGARPEEFLFYGGFDLWRFSLSGYTGLYWAPGGQNNDGFQLKLFMSQGLELYRTTSVLYITDIYRASVTPGWRIKRGGLELKLFVGFDLETDHLSPTPPLTTTGPSLGLRAAAEFWWEPTPDWMLASSVSSTTINSGHDARIAAGWRTPDLFWLGPEITFSNDQFSRQVHIGAHLTGLKIDDFEWSVAAGYLEDSSHRRGTYARVGLSTRQ